MSDTSIFIFGCVVFGITLASTVAISIAPSQNDVERRKAIEETGRENPAVKT